MAAAHVMATQSAIYLYCVVKSTRRPPLARAPEGLAGATRPEAHDAGKGLWLITAEVPLSQYGPGRLEPRLQDLDWVATTAVTHEAVVEHFARAKGAAVIPAKLFTMFSSIDKAIADVVARRTSIGRVMTRIAGCEEWGIRVTRRVSGPEVQERAAASTSGAAFLAARKAARDATANARAAAVAAAENAFHSLARHTRDARARDRRPEPGTNPPVLEAAFLVLTSARTRFKAEARRQAAACAAAGADLTLTGPWPAYNFVGDSA